MFFRVVSLSYKGKEYRYLRLMKSIRRGKKVRQLEIMNLANISHLPGHAADALIEDLKRLLSLCDDLCRQAGPGAKISFLLALESAFQPRAACPGRLLRDIYSGSAADGGAAGSASDLLFNHIRGLHADTHNGNFILWLTPLDFPDSPEKPWAGYLMTETGFPVKHYILDQQNFGGQALEDIKKDLKQKYGSSGILLLVDNPQRPDAEWHENENNEFSSVLADSSILSGGGLENMIAEAAAAVNCYRKFVERIAGVYGDEMTPGRLLDMFMMFHLFKALALSGIIQPLMEKYKASGK